MLKNMLIMLCLAFSAVCYGADQPDQQTLSIVKPDAVAAKRTGAILSRFEQEGLRIAALKMVQLTKAQAQSFYQEHQGKPFYDNLTTFMSSGPVVALVLEGPNAIQRTREVMGATNPREAQAGTLRKMYGASIDNNAVHGSDSPESAKREIAFFFKPHEIVNGTK